MLLAEVGISVLIICKFSNKWTCTRKKEVEGLSCGFEEENTKNGYSYSWNFQEYKTAEATFNFEWTDYTSTFMIMDATSAMAQVQEEIGIQIHGILGIQFLLEHKWLLLLHSAIR